MSVETYKFTGGHLVKWGNHTRYHRSVFAEYYSSTDIRPPGEGGCRHGSPQPQNFINWDNCLNILTLFMVLQVHDFVKADRTKRDSEEINRHL